MPPADGGSATSGPCGAITQRPAPCTDWRIAGSDAVVSGPYGTYFDGGASQVGYSTPSLVRSGDGALIAWTASFYSSNTPTVWATRAIHFDGTARSAVVSHAPFPVRASVGQNFMSLAVTPQCAFGMLASSDALVGGDDEHGCAFVPLDGDGNEIGPVVGYDQGAPDASVPPSGNLASGYCLDLGPAPGGFSYIQQVPNSATTGTGDLVTVGSNGRLRVQAPLGTFQQYNPWRLVLDDESFLLNSFVVTDAANDYTWTVAHYDASGVQIGPETTLATSEGFFTAETSSGVLAAYAARDPATQLQKELYVVPLSRDGMPTAAPVALPVTGTAGPVFSFALEPSPSGDAILHWTNFVEPIPAGGYHSYAMELDPGGGQRGSVLDFGSLSVAGDGSFLVSTDGDRALVVYSPSDGVHALPLACAAH